MRIVVMDDNPDIRKMLKTALESKGHEVFTFDNPKICPLQMIPVCRCEENEKCADLIITDIEMPEMDGFEFLENHRAKNCHCKDVFVMSGRLNRGDVERATALGCKTFHKPLQLAMLFDQVEQVERKISPERRLRDWFLEVIPNGNSNK